LASRWRHSAWPSTPCFDTIEPTFLSKQGVLGQAEWRQRLANGFYNVRVSGQFGAR
jgi:LPS-assembly protein